MDTRGLAPFGLPDLQVHFRDLEPARLAGLLYATAGYLLEEGDVIADGNTISGPRRRRALDLPPRGRPRRARRDGCSTSTRATPTPRGAGPAEPRAPAPGVRRRGYSSSLLTSRRRTDSSSTSGR